MTDKQKLMNEFFEDHQYVQPLPDWHKNPEATEPPDDEAPQPLRSAVSKALAAPKA